MKKSIICALVAISVSGCSLMRGETTVVNIKCHADNATIYVSSSDKISEYSGHGNTAYANNNSVAFNIVNNYNEAPKWFNTNTDNYSIRTPNNYQMDILCKADGYRDAHYKISSNLSWTGKLDAVGVIVVLPILGLMTGGAWELTDDTVNLYPSKIN